MSDKYIPTTKDVRRAYQEHCRDYDAVDGLATSPESYEEEFDRWLDKVKAEAQVEALREVANSWQINGWAQYVPPRDYQRHQLIIGMAQQATEFIRDRADRIAREAGIVSEGTTTGESND